MSRIQTPTALALATVILLGLLSAGCQTQPRITGTLNPNASRSQKLMAMAADEAGNIPEPDMRLTRQLNLADQQIQRGWKTDAQTTLAHAAGTLKSKDAVQLNDHARVSGWISISQLGRQTDATALAAEACDNAVAVMEKIEDPAKRCQYVFGVANELQYHKGQPAAAAILSKAGPWTRSIDNLKERRDALVSFASALFNFDDYPAGQAMLHQDDDPAWRSDTLTRLANFSPATPAMVADQQSASSPRQEQPYGKQLDYRSIFQNQTKSNTSKD